MYTIFGVDKDSYEGRLGDVISSIIHPDDLHVVMPDALRSRANGEAFEYRIILSDGSIRYISARSGESVFAEDGTLLVMRGVAPDITDIKTTQAALAESEAKYRSLVETAQELV